MVDPLTDDIVDAELLNDRGYIDIDIVVPGYAADLDVATVTDLDPEFTITVDDAADGTLILDSSQPPLLVGFDEGTSTYTFRYWYSGSFTSGDVTIDFIGDSFDFVDLAGDTTGNFADFTAQVQDDGTLFILVPFGEFATLDTGTINNSDISGPAGFTLTLQGAQGPPGTFRFNITPDDPQDDLAVGDDFIISYSETASAWTYNTTLSAFVEPSRALTISKTHTYLDIRFPSAGDIAIDLTTIDGNEFTLGGAGLGTATLDATEAASALGDNTFRYYLNRGFVAGPVDVSFKEGKWSDEDGTQSTASTESFLVIEAVQTNDSSGRVFFIEIAGGITLKAAGLLDEPLLEIRGQVTIEIDSARGLFTLDASGTIRIFKLGNIASGAARFVLATGNTLSGNPEFWGVLKLQTNLDFFEQFGIIVNASVLLQINTTPFKQTEKISLEGIVGDLIEEDLALVTSGLISELSTTLLAEADVADLTAAWTTALEDIDIDPDTTGDQEMNLTDAVIQTLKASTKWKVTDGDGKQFFIELVDSKVEVRSEFQTFVLQPESFLLQLVGEITIKNPLDTNPNIGARDTWLSIRGGLQIQISSDGFEFFVLAKLDLKIPSFAKVALIVVNPALALVNEVDIIGVFVLRTGLGDNNDEFGIAGMVEVKLDLGVDFGVAGVTANVGSFSFTDTFKLAFNSFLEEFRFDIPDAFLGLLDPGDPTAILLPAGPSDSVAFILSSEDSGSTKASIELIALELPTVTFDPVALSSAWITRFSGQATPITFDGTATVQAVQLNVAGDAIRWEVADVIVLAEDVNLLTGELSTDALGQVLVTDLTATWATLLALIDIDPVASGVQTMNLTGAVIQTLSPGSRWKLTDGDDEEFFLDIDLGADLNNAADDRVDVSGSAADYFIQLVYDDDTPANATLAKLNIGTAGAPAAYLELKIIGELNLLDVVTLTGEFQLVASVVGLVATVEIKGFVSANIKFLGAVSGVVSFTRVVDVGTPLNSGMFGAAQLTLASNGIIPGVDLNGTLFIEVNISNKAQTFNTFSINSTTGAVTGPTSKTIDPGLTFGFGGSLEIADIVELKGSFLFSFLSTDDGVVLVVTANASLNLGLLGSVGVIGGFRIDANGLVLKLGLTLAAGGDIGKSIGLSFTASATLELNTSSSAQTLDIGGVDHVIQSGFKLTIKGSVEFLGFASATGTVTISIGGGAFKLEFDVVINLGPISLKAKGFAGIFTGANAGMVLRLDVKLDVNILEIFKIKAGGVLELNTSGVSRVANGVNIAANSFTLIMIGEIKILEVLKFDTTFSIFVGGNRTVSVGSTAGKFNTSNQIYLGVGDWVFDFTANMDFFGIATLNASGWLNSKGHFNITVGGGMTLGSSSFGLFGRADFHVFLDVNPDTELFRFGVEMQASFGARAFGITFASVGLGFKLGAEGQGRVPVKATVNFSVKILFIRIRASFNITLGYIILPKVVYLAGDAGTGTGNTQRFTGGALHLNIGDTRAADRGIAETEKNETFIVEHLSGDASGEKVKVIFGGREKIYDGVTSIHAAAGLGNDQIFIRPGVLVPVFLDGGDGNDLLVYEGSGAATLTGGNGDDALITGLAAGAAIINAGAGNDYVSHRGTGTGTITGGAGVDQLFGGPGNDIIRGGDDDDEIDGRGGVDQIFGDAGNDLIKWTVSGALSEKIINNAFLTDASQPKFVLVPLWVIGESTVTTVEGGAGNDFLVISGTTGADIMVVDSPAATKVRIAKANSDASITGKDFENVELRAGNGADTITVGYLGGSGVTNFTVDAGKNIVDTLRTTVVADPDSDILVADLANDTFVNDLTTGNLAQIWKTELDKVAALDPDFAFDINNLVLQPQLSVITANSKFQITDSKGNKLFIVRDPVENVFDIRTGVLVNVEVAVLSIAPDNDADTIIIQGSELNDNITVAGRNATGGQIRDIGVVLKDASGNVVTTVLVVNSVRGEGDKLKIEGLGGDDLINASALGDSNPDDDVTFPDLTALFLIGGDGDDILIGTPFNDVLDSGLGSDTVTGGPGLDQFFDNSGENDVDTLVETINADLALFDNYFIVGTILQDTGSNRFALGTAFVEENAVIDAVRNEEDPDFTPANLGDRFAAGAIVEVLINRVAGQDANVIFERAIINGGATNNTIVVNDIDNTIEVGGQTLTAKPWNGRVTLDNQGNEEAFVEHFIVTIPLDNGGRIEIVDTGGPSGVDILIIYGTNQADDIVLNAAGSGSFRVGSVVAREVSSTLITYRNVERVIINTLGGSDRVLANDTVVPTIINLGGGDDEVVIGTVPLIPDEGNRTLEFPDGVPVADTEAMTNGNSATLFIFGQGQNDRMEVNHNRAALYLHGGAGNDRFLLKTFLVLKENPENPDEVTNLTNLFGGTGTNRYNYLQNAPVFINGGPGIDVIVVIGTPIGDVFVITENYIAGAGRIVTFTGVEAVEVDGAGGPDEIYVLSTGDSFETTVTGGSGDDTIHIGGDHPPLIFDPPEFTYVPPPIEVSLPPELIFTEFNETWNGIRLEVGFFDLFNSIVFNNGSVQGVVQNFVDSLIAAWSASIPFFEIDNVVISDISIVLKHDFFFSFLFLPRFEITATLRIDYRLGTLEPRSKLIQPAPVQVDPPAFAFKEAASFDGQKIAGRLTIVGGDQFEDGGDTIIFHNQENTGDEEGGTLRFRETPRMIQTGEDENGIQIFEQDRDADSGELLTDVFQSIEGFGLGINEAGQAANDTVVYHGIEFKGIENLELRLPGDWDDVVTIEAVGDNLNVTIVTDAGVDRTGSDPVVGGNDTINVEAVGALMTILAGPGNDVVNITAVGEVEDILGRMVIRGDATLIERVTSFNVTDFGSDVIDFVPKVFVDTDLPDTVFQGKSFVSNPLLEPIVEVGLGGPGDLLVRVVVLDDGGAIIRDFVQEKGVPEFALQKTDPSNAPLFFDLDGNETTDGTITGVPVLVLVDNNAQPPVGLPVFVDNVGNKLLTATRLADDDELDNDGDGFVDEPGEIADNTRSFATDFENGTFLSLDRLGRKLGNLPSILVQDLGDTGVDFTVYELDQGGVEFGNVVVEVSNDGETYYTLVAKTAVSIAGDSAHSSASFRRSYDINDSPLTEARFIRLTGLSPGSGIFAGFDLDAIGIINTGPEGIKFLPTLWQNTTTVGNDVFVGAPDDIGLGISVGIVEFGAAPSLVEVNRTTAVPWTFVEDIVVEGPSAGTDTLFINNGSDTSDVAGTLDTFAIAVDVLVGGQQTFHDGSDSPDAKVYFGGEPVIDPFTHEQLFYESRVPVLDLFTGAPVLDPFNAPVLHEIGDPIRHVAGEPVAQLNGDIIRFLGGEFTFDESGDLVLNPVRMTQSPTLDFVTDAGGDKIIRSAGNWRLDQFSVGDRIQVSGAGSNNTAIDSGYTIAAIEDIDTVNPDGRVLILSLDDQLTNASTVSNAEVTQLLIHLPGQAEIFNRFVRVLQLVDETGALARKIHEKLPPNSNNVL